MQLLRCYCWVTTGATSASSKTSSHMLAKGLITSGTLPPSLAFRTTKELRGECPGPEGSQALPQLFTAEPWLLTESLVVITSFVCPNESLDFDNVIYLRNKEESPLLSCPPGTRKSIPDQPATPEDTHVISEILQPISIALSSLMHPGKGLNLWGEEPGT